jgi:glucosamine 6-phosphate synthetase-like amidotransferase/phosphosugar isomerase protein
MDIFFDVIMCQLAAYVGDRPIAPLLLRALELQEPYWGGHATGLAVIDDGLINIEKDYGHVARVRHTTTIESLQGNVGIAHSRYNDKARDDPRYNTKEMAHPFLNDDDTLALMHNGTIYNYKDHWGQLKKNHMFGSYIPEINAITDSEIAVHMLNDALSSDLSMEEAFRKITPQYHGGFLLAAISPVEPEAIWIANWFQPCVVAIGDNEAMFCSSHIGFHEVRDVLDRIFKPPKNSIIKLTKGKVFVTPMDPGRRIPRIKLDLNKAAELVLRQLNERKEIDFANLWDSLHPEGWAECFRIPVVKLEKFYKQGFRFVNEYIEVLDMLIANGHIQKRVNHRKEGGVTNIPRFSYCLSQ